jgi:hypothetical protein
LLGLNQKKPWVTPRLHRIELTEEALELFRSKNSTITDLADIPQHRPKRAATR